MAVVGGICHSALARLSKTNLYLSAEDQKVMRIFHMINKLVFKKKFFLSLFNIPIDIKWFYGIIII